MVSLGYNLTTSETTDALIGNITFPQANGHMLPLFY